MDPRKLMERLKGAAALTEQDVGEFSHFKGKMMKISVHSYAVEDWGSLSLLESRGMAGLMRRDMLVINSCVKDIPVLVIQYMGLFGRRMLQVHVLDVMKDKTAAGRFASLGRMAEQSGTAVQETPVEWYTPIQLPGSVTVMTNGDGGEKVIELGPDRAGATFRDFLGHREDEVVLDDQGRGAFPVNGGSVSVWVPAEAL